MKIGAFAALAAAFSVTVLAGCGDKAAETTEATPPATTSTPAATAVTTANAKGSVKVGDQAVCIVCAVKEGATAKEEVKAVLDYKDKTYAFCNDAEKAEFISEPAKFAQAQ